MTDFFLKVNPTKTKTQIVNFNFHPAETDNLEYPTSIINAVSKDENVDIENLEVMTYLGVEIDRTQPGTGDTEVNNRIESAKVAFAINKNLFCNHHLSLGVRVRFFNALIRSKLTYGCQNWALTIAQYNRIDACQNIMFRKMIRGGFKRAKVSEENSNEFKFYYPNVRILKITKSEFVSDYIKRQQRNYVAHLIRTSNTNPTKQMMHNSDKYHKRGRQAPELYQQVIQQSGVPEVEFRSQAVDRKF